mmetsp:Transcript_43557/g.103530  ORF Transcript_43557/g.103530 Transcript_43557/m.103530 type:complete len:242 (+) Transcript_43557:507-1232(+)
MRDRLNHGVRCIGHRVLKHAELLLCRDVLRDRVEVVERGHGAPAEREHPRVHRLHVVKELAELAPVLDLIKREVLDGRARDDHAVVLLPLDLAEPLVEIFEVAWRRVLARVVVRDAECDVAQRRGPPQHPAQLKVRLLLEWHEVQNKDLDARHGLLEPLLPVRPGGFHPHALRLELLERWEARVEARRHQDSRRSVKGSLVAPRDVRGSARPTPCGAARGEQRPHDRHALILSQSWVVCLD